MVEQSMQIQDWGWLAWCNTRWRFVNGVSNQVKNLNGPHAKVNEVEIDNEEIRSVVSQY